MIDNVGFYKKFSFTFPIFFRKIGKNRDYEVKESKHRMGPKTFFFSSEKTRVVPLTD